MFSLKLEYIISVIITGFILLLLFIQSVPDGKLHIHYCAVGQGDAAYIRFPSGNDMIVDGGPNNALIQCLSRYMPFWDRTIDIVLMTHPQKDHFYGLIEVLNRYHVQTFIQSDIQNNSEEYKQLDRIIQKKNIRIRYMTDGERIVISDVSLTFLWPTQSQIAFGKSLLTGENLSLNQDVLGANSSDYNDFSLVFLLSYGNFQSLFPGDGDTRIEKGYVGYPLPDGQLEVLKVPHHGSKTGIDEAYVDWLFGGASKFSLPSVGIISVGKNTYGHPSDETISLLKEYGVSLYRTDSQGDIEIVSDGLIWNIITQKE